MPHPANQSDQHTMSFGDHLEELRRRVLLSLIFPIPVAILTFFVLGLTAWVGPQGVFSTGEAAHIFGSGSVLRVGRAAANPAGD